MGILLEVPVFNIEAAVQAEQAGADRIELCDNPAEGGTTPSLGITAQVIKLLTIGVFIMIRPRGGNFVYSREEIEAMRRDIEQCRQVGANGVVLGVLNEEGRLNVKQCRELIQLARPMQVTLHRAFDVTRNLNETLEDAIEAGFDRILTSGGRPSAEEGIEQLAGLVQQATNRIVIMAGAGIQENNAKRIVEQTRVREIHCSARVWQPYTGSYTGLSFNQNLPREAGRFLPDGVKLSKIRKEIGGQ